MMRIIKLLIYGYIGFVTLFWAFVPLAFNDSGASDLGFFKLLEITLFGILPISLFVFICVYKLTKHYAKPHPFIVPIVISTMIFILYFNLVNSIYG